MICRKFIWFFFILLLGACYQTSAPAAFNMEMILPAEKMVEIITDLHLADATINLESKKGIPVEQLSGEYFLTVMEKHGVEPEVFEESVRYYAYYADQMDAIYEKVIVNLSLKESQVHPE